MNETLPLDAWTVSETLGIEAGYLADMFRREAARLLRTAAAQLETHDVVSAHAADQTLEDAAELLVVASVFDDEWERQHPEREKNDEAEHGTEATPLTRTTSSLRPIVPSALDPADGDTAISLWPGEPPKGA